MHVLAAAVFIMVIFPAAAGAFKLYMLIFRPEELREHNFHNPHNRL